MALIDETYISRLDRQDGWGRGLKDDVLTTIKTLWRVIGEANAYRRECEATVPDIGLRRYYRSRFFEALDALEKETK